MVSQDAHAPAATPCRRVLAPIPLRAMPKPVVIWIAFCAVHLGLAGMSLVVGMDALSAFIAGTIYLPLWPFDQFGVPVFERNRWMLPPPNALGWAIVFGVWALVHGVLANVASRLLRKP